MAGARSRTSGSRTSTSARSLRGLRVEGGHCGLTGAGQQLGQVAVVDPAEPVVAVAGADTVLPLEVGAGLPLRALQLEPDDREHVAEADVVALHDDESTGAGLPHALVP